MNINFYILLVKYFRYKININKILKNVKYIIFTVNFNESENIKKILTKQNLNIYLPRIINYKPELIKISTVIFSSSLTKNDKKNILKCIFIEIFNKSINNSEAYFYILFFLSICQHIININAKKLFINFLQIILPHKINNLNKNIFYKIKFLFYSKKILDYNFKELYNNIT